MHRLRTKKTITQLLICIVLGCITSVGVAWIIVFIVNSSSSNIIMNSQQQSLPGGVYVSEVFYETVSGGPLDCIVSETHVNAYRLPKTPVAYYEEPIPIPIRLIWLALLLNTSLYAFIIWPVLFGRVLVRYTIRRKRGLCIHCRYNVRDLLTCPECGSEVVTSGPRATQLADLLEKGSIEFIQELIKGVEPARAETPATVEARVRSKTVRLGVMC